MLFNPEPEPEPCHIPKGDAFLHQRTSCDTCRLFTKRGVLNTGPPNVEATKQREKSPKLIKRTVIFLHIEIFESI